MKLKKRVCATRRIPFSLIGAGFALAEAEEQNNHGDQNDPKQNVFAEEIASAVHSVTPFFDTEIIFGSLILYDRGENV